MTSRSAAATTVDDRELVCAFLDRREEQVFVALYRRHTPRLYQLVLRVLAWNEGAAEEVIQETWIRALERLAGFRWKSTLGTWLAAIAVNVCREQLRRHTHRSVADDETGDAFSIPESVMDIDLERAISALPDGYRTVLVLHDVEGHTHEEISRLLGIEIGTSKSQLFHARRSIRQRLEASTGRAQRER